MEKPFLNTTRAIIYIRTGEVHFQFPKEKVRCCFNNYNAYDLPNKNRIRRCRAAKKKQSKKEEEEKIEEIIVENFIDEGQVLATPERSPPPKKVWRKKESASSPTTTLEPSESPTVTTDTPSEE